MYAEQSERLISSLGDLWGVMKQKSKMDDREIIEFCVTTIQKLYYKNIGKSSQQ